MITRNVNFRAPDGTELLGYQWTPDAKTPVKGVVQICHGMAETALRYERFAGKLCGEGYAVFAYDQRGHGRTARALENVGYIADGNGMDILVEDLLQATGIARKECPGLPVFLFAHSMGSFVGQRFIQLYGGDLRGVVLSGSNGRQGIMLTLGGIAANAEVKKAGRKTRSPKLTALSFGSFNKAFRPNRTDYDWLSRDNAEVDKYVNDPYCGGIFTAGFFADLIVFLKKIQKPENVRLIPVALPVLLMAGAKDPVSNSGKGVLTLKKTYKDLGVKDLVCTLYPDARHETLNETNREEVMSDVLAWFNRHI